MTPTTEPMILRTRDGSETRASGEVARVSGTGRMIRAGVPVAGGLVLGAITLPIPGLHFFAPWFLPLLGIGMGVYLSKVKANVAHMEGPCPKCGARVSADGLGSLGADPVWLRCDTCGAPLELRLPPAEG
ncbi:MAG: hypothetical protein R3F59_37440 [Myxococcota bacterium]